MYKTSGVRIGFQGVVQDLRGPYRISGVCTRPQGFIQDSRGSYKTSGVHMVLRVSYRTLQDFEIIWGVPKFGVDMEGML